MKTTIAIAILATALAFPTMTAVAFAQSSSNDFQEFTECLFGDGATAQDVEDVLQGNSADVTEQEIRDCFSPIYNDGTDDATGSSNSDNDDNDDSTSNSNNNGDEEEDSTEETDSTDNTDTTERDDTTDTTEDTDSTDSTDTTEEEESETESESESSY